MKVAEWDDASDTFDSSQEADELNAQTKRLGQSSTPSKTGWISGEPVSTLPLSRDEKKHNDEEEDYSGFSIEEDLSDGEQSTEAAPTNEFTSNNDERTFSSDGNHSGGTLMRRSNQEDDLPGNDFSIESATVKKSSSRAKAVSDDEEEYEAYEHDDFEFEEEVKDAGSPDKSNISAPEDVVMVS